MKGWSLKLWQGRNAYVVLFLVSTSVLVSVSGQDTKVEDVEEGTNFCTAEMCFCDTYSDNLDSSSNLTQIPIVLIDCRGKNLRNIFEESDWNATFKALNISNDRRLDVRFDNNDIGEIFKFPKLNISVLSFYRNNISKIAERAFAELTSLDSLNLSFNQLTGESLFEGVFFGQYNNSENNPGYFPLPVRHLNLSHNLIHSLETDLFDHFTSLRTIDLSHNPLTVLSGSTSMAISSLRKLEYLGLSYTSISSLPEGILHDLKFLVALDISGNEFTSVPAELSYSHELEVLTVNANKFETLDRTSFAGLDKLQDLGISNINTLKEIDNGTFGPLKSLTKLEITFNRRLSKLHNDAFLGLVDKDTPEEWRIKELHLNDNGLTHIDQALVPWEYIDYVDIQNNPFRCDCNLDWMVTVLVDRIYRTNPVVAVDLTCAEPKDMKGRSLEELSKEPEIFSRCRSGGLSLTLEDYDMSHEDPYKSAGLTVLIIGIMLIIIGLSILGFIVVKRRAIAQALTAHSQIRYERADTGEDGEFGDSRKYTGPSSIYK